MSINSCSSFEINSDPVVAHQIVIVVQTAVGNDEVGKGTGVIVQANVVRFGAGHLTIVDGDCSGHLQEPGSAFTLARVITLRAVESAVLHGQRRRVLNFQPKVGSIGHGDST